MASKFKPPEELKFDDTHVALRLLNKHFQYNDLEDEMIRDSLVVGMRKKAAKERLLRDAHLTLTTSI